MNSKTISILVLAGAILVAAVAAIVVTGNRKAKARAEADRVEAAADKAKAEAKKAEAEAASDRAKVESQKTALKLAEENRKAQEAEREASANAAEKAKEDRARAEAEKVRAASEAQTAADNRAAEKSRAETARAEAEKAKQDALQCRQVELLELVKLLLGDDLVRHQLLTRQRIGCGLRLGGLGFILQALAHQRADLLGHGLDFQTDSGAARRASNRSRTSSR